MLFYSSKLDLWGASDVNYFLSKNMEALTNLILAMNDRVNAQEENHKDKENPNTNDLKSHKGPF